jgi:histidine triad (HIT) family protein
MLLPVTEEAPNGCTFCAIATGLAPAEVILRTPDVTAFLDLRPVFPGHLLVVPRPHHHTLADLPSELVGTLFETVQRLSAVVPVALEADGTFVAVNNRVSQSVAHLHVHVVPRRFKDGLRGFFWPRQRYESTEAMAHTAGRIRQALGSP